MKLRPLAVVAACAALPLALMACGGAAGSPPSASSSAPPAAPFSAAAPVSSAVSSSPAVATPSPRPTAVPSATPTAQAVSVKQLKGALLTAKDVPPTYKVDKSNDDDEESAVSSTQKGCRTLVEILNFQYGDPKGLAHEADVTFVERGSGATFAEQLASYDSADSAAGAVDIFRKAASGCKKVTVSLKGAGRGSATVEEHKIPGFKANHTAVRVSVSKGALAGLDVLFADTQIDTVELSTFSIGLSSVDAGSAIGAAYGKAKEKLRMV